MIWACFILALFAVGLGVYILKTRPKFKYTDNGIVFYDRGGKEILIEAEKK